MSVLSTIAPFGFGYDTGEFLRAYAAIGCTRAQFYRKPGTEIRPEDAARVAADAKTPIDSIHGAFGEAIDPSSPDPDERARCLRLYEEEARFTRDLGADTIVVHPARFNDGRAVLSPDEANELQESRWAPLDDFMRRLAELAERQGVRFCIENQPRNCPLGHDPVALAARIDAVGAERLRMCFDTGHAHLVGDAPDLLRQCLPVVGYIHAHDNDARLDNHRMPGDGSIDWDRLAQVVRASPATRMLEVFYDAKQVRGLADAGFADPLRSMLAL